MTAASTAAFTAPLNARKTVLVVAAISARMMAEAAARDGFEVVALDLFGDADTRRAADWRPIGGPSALRINTARTLAALRELAARGDVAGWVAGSGFEGLPHLLAHGARLLPLLGTAAADVRRLRDAATFFASGEAFTRSPLEAAPGAEAALALDSARGGAVVSAFAAS